MLSEIHIKPNLAVKLEKAGWRQEPPVLRRERLHAGVVAISVTSKRRLARPRSPRPSPPLHLRTAATKQLPVRVSKQTVKTHSSRIERRAARGGGAEQWRASSRLRLRVTEGEKQIGPCGAEKHRIAPPRTSMSISSSRCASYAQQLGVLPITWLCISRYSVSEPQLAVK